MFFLELDELMAPATPRSGSIPKECVNRSNLGLEKSACRYRNVDVLLKHRMLVLENKEEFCEDASSRPVYEVRERHGRGVCVFYNTASPVAWQLTAVVLSQQTLVLYFPFEKLGVTVLAEARWGFPINKCTESIYTVHGTWRHNTHDILFSSRCCHKSLCRIK